MSRSVSPSPRKPRHHVPVEFCEAVDGPRHLTSERVERQTFEGATVQPGAPLSEERPRAGGVPVRQVLVADGDLHEALERFPDPPVRLTPPRLEELVDLEVESGVEE